MNDEQELETVEEELGFKDYVNNDIGDAFLNMEEFADEHMINDTKVNCIVQKCNINDELTVGNKDGYFPDLYGDTKTINVAKKDLEEMPVYGQTIYLDCERYDVVSVADDMGMLTIVVVGNRR